MGNPDIAPFKIRVSLFSFCLFREGSSIPCESCDLSSYLEHPLLETKEQSVGLGEMES